MAHTALNRFLQQDLEDLVNLFDNQLFKNQKSPQLKGTLLYQPDIFCDSTDTQHSIDILVPGYSKEEIKLETNNEECNKNTQKSDSKLYISEPSDSDDSYVPYNLNEPSKKRIKIEIPKCPGCYPVFQDNQEGHIGPNGCLGDLY